MLIFPYNSAWVKDFELIEAKLLDAFNDIHVSVEHVGSTAVPGLDAKPIIDIDIVYNKITDFEAIKNGLQSLGYYHNGNQDVEGREVFKRQEKAQDEILDTIVHHLYVCHNDCAELHRHLLFRDYLRKNETTRKFYQNLKYEIAHEAKDNKKIYATIKEVKATSFVNYIIELSRLGL